jgi:hypothetical protein
MTGRSNMSRTDEARGGGHERKGTGGGGTPFVKWGEKYAWIEGKIVGSFNTKYGLAITLDVADVGGAILDAQGVDEEGEKFTVRVERGLRISIGTQSATLQGKITAEDVDKAFHIAFEGWEEPKGGNRYRVFTVIELSQRELAGRGQGAEHDDDDGLPF